MAATLATCHERFLADARPLDRLRPHTLRAYRYELAAAARDPRFAGALDALPLADLEGWIARAPAAPSTVGRRLATFRRFFAWAVRHGHCARLPLLDDLPARRHRVCRDVYPGAPLARDGTGPARSQPSRIAIEARLIGMSAWARRPTPRPAAPRVGAARLLRRVG